jgi:replicative DNA helicase
MSDRVPPYDLNAEYAVLGGVMLTNAALADVIERGVVAEDFYLPQHRAIFETMIALDEEGKPIDLLSVPARLASRDLEGSRGTTVSDATLAELAARVPTSTNVGYYARLVKEAAQLRQIIAASGEVQSKAFLKPPDVPEFLDWCEQHIGQASDRRTRQAYVPVSKIVVKVVEEIARRYDRGGGITGIGTGYPDLDRMLAGLHSQELVILAARPSMGKSAMALNFAYNAATTAGVPSLIFSREMSKESLGERLVCLNGKFDSKDIRTGKLQGKEWGALTESTNGIYGLPICIDDSAASSLMEIRAKARKWRRDRAYFPKGDEPGQIIIDYLQLITSSAGQKEDSREREVSRISQGLKALAKELNLPVLALSQLNRKVEQRENKRPNLSDLRESGSIEQDADVVMFLYREAVYNEDKRDDKTTEVIVSKQRNGPIGTVNLCFLDYCGRFESMDDRREP